LARAADDRYQLPIRIGAYVGLRAGEVGGLLVEDIDFEACRIYVRRNIQEVHQDDVRPVRRPVPEG
jgi:integrase